MKSLFATLFLASSVSLLSSCGTAQNTTSSPSELNGEWRITKVEGTTVSSENTENEAYMSFDVNEKQMQGCAGCNRIFGPFEAGAKNGTLKFGNTGSTRMMCANMDVEDKVLNAMGKVAQFKIVDGKELTLKDAQGNALIILEKK